MFCHLSQTVLGPSLSVSGWSVLSPQFCLHQSLQGSTFQDFSNFDMVNSGYSRDFVHKGEAQLQDDRPCPLKETEQLREISKFHLADTL